jgi:hypothetical protein
MSKSILRITDGTAAGTVDFIGGPLYVRSWAPVVPGYKDGGQYIDPPIAPGRRIAFYMRENAIERLDFAQRADSGDSGDEQLGRLIRLLDRAAEHWTTNGRKPPIWLEVRNPRQANIRYAKIVAGRLTGMDNQFASPYLQDEGCTIVEAGLTVLLERRNFNDAIPGTTSSLALTGNARTINMLFDHSFERPYSLGIVWLNRNSNYSREIVTSPVYHGDVALKITADSTGGAVRQVVYGLVAGTTATCTVMVKVETGTARLQVYDGSGWTSGVSDTTTSTSWTQLSVSKTVPFSGEINFALELVNTNDVAYFDYATVNYTYGKSATATTDQLYFANGRVEYPITHIYHYDASLTSFSSNLVGTSTPYALLPSTVQVGDYIAFGAAGATILDGGGPFTNILFDISTAADITLNWKYMDKFGSLQDLSVIDNTENFSVLGENIVQLTRDSTWGDEFINSRRAWWIVATVATVGSTTPPQQDTFDPFPISDNYVELPAASLGGDTPPTVDLRVTNEGAATIVPREEFLGSGNDDGYWDLGPPSAGVLGGATITIGQDSAALIRYPDVSIPQGAQISRARFTAISNGGSTGTWNARLYIEQSDDAAVLTTDSGEPTNRTWSDDLRDWNIDADFWNANTGYQFNGPEVTSMVQEIVDRPGWVEDNAMCFKIQDWVVGATDNRSFEAYETEAGAWQLIIEYVNAELYTTNIILGARNMSRGADFRSVINITPLHRDAMSVALGTNTIWQEAYRDGPPHTARWHPMVSMTAALATQEGGVFLDRAIITIPTDLASSFAGNFRAFIRAYNQSAPTTSDTPMFRLRVSTGGESFFTQSTALSVLETPELLDLGIITIPDFDVSPQNLDMLTVVLGVQMRASGATDLSLLDLILIPVDEWTAEVKSPLAVSGAQTAGKTVEIKSVNTAGKLKSTMVTEEGKTVVWRVSGTQMNPPLDETTRIYFVTSTDETIGGTASGGDQLSNKASWGNLAYSLTAEYVNSYLLYGSAL